MNQLWYHFKYIRMGPDIVEALKREQVRRHLVVDVLSHVQNTKVLVYQDKAISVRLII